MDQFSHDLTLALEETSLMDRACGVSRWGSRRRTRSTGNLPCAPQPTEDSSSPTDTLNARGHGHGHGKGHGQELGQGSTIYDDGVDPCNIYSTFLPASDSDDKAEVMLPLRLHAAAAVRMGLESDSLNETNFSPARFYKPNSRRKRKIKRMSMEFEFSKDSNLAVSPHCFTHESPLQPGMLTSCLANATGTIRKRILKTENCTRSNLLFCGKRKRSNRDRYQEQDAGVAAEDLTESAAANSMLQSSSMPRYTHMDEYQRMRPRSYSSTSKPHSDRLLPLNKGLLSKINRMAQMPMPAPQAQKTDNTTTHMDAEGAGQPQQQQLLQKPAKKPELPAELATDFSMETLMPVSDIETLLSTTDNKLQLQLLPQQLPCLERKKSQLAKSHRRRRFCQTPQSHLQLQLQLHSQSMDCTELYDFVSSSSLSSSSDSDDGYRRHDTDREGDDELTDWPGNEFGGKYDPKRKLTKKSLLPQIRSDDTIGEDDTLMSGPEATATAIDATSQSPPTLLPDALQDLSRFQPAASSEPIEICGGGTNRGFIDANIFEDVESSSKGMPAALNQIESEMSGETSNPFLSSSPPMAVQEVREIRAGCRRINGDRPGFTIKLSANERLSRFLQDPRQTQIRLPDIEIYEQDSLLNLATLYSLNMFVEDGCTILAKTRNTTQSVHIDPQRSLHERKELSSDHKRRCYGDNAGDAPLATTTTAAAPSTAAFAAELMLKK